MSRTPPSSGRFVVNDPVPIYVFEKNEGSSSSTFMSRLVHRVPIRLALRDGSGTIDVVRYAGRYWPTYKPETFSEKSQQWVDQADTIYDPDYETLKLPLQHAYLFECDTPDIGYD